MKKILLAIFCVLLISKVQAQQTSYTITKNDPEWSSIPNLYVTPLLTLDVPFSNDGTNAGSLGWGVRTHAIVKGKYFVDVNYMGSLWNIVTDIDTKPRLFELGGAMLLKSNISERNIKVVTSRQSLYSERVGDKVRTTESITYIEVPGGKELSFAGVRGGLYTFRSIFEYSVPGIPPAGSNFNVPDEEVRGWTNAIGLYAGWTLGKVNNLQINRGGRNYSEMKYTRWYADILLAGLSHQYIENQPNNDRNALPIGFRVGFETTNRTDDGTLGRVIQAELGYRPGFNGFYTTIGFSFLQVRKSIGALM